MGIPRKICSDTQECENSKVHLNNLFASQFMIATRDKSWWNWVIFKYISPSQNYNFVIITTKLFHIKVIYKMWTIIIIE